LGSNAPAMVDPLQSNLLANSLNIQGAGLTVVNNVTIAGSNGQQAQSVSLDAGNGTLTLLSSPDQADKLVLKGQSLILPVNATTKLYANDIDIASGLTFKANQSLLNGKLELAISSDASGAPSGLRLNGDDASSIQTFNSPLTAWTTATAGSSAPLYLYNPTGLDTNVALGSFANGAKVNGQDVWTNLNFNHQGGTIRFDLKRLDTWGPNENFSVFANDVAILNTIFTWDVNESTTRRGNSNGYSWTITPLNDYVYGPNGASGFTSQTFRFDIKISTTITNLKLGFGSNLDESIDNESYAIDNVNATTTLGQVLMDESFDAALGGWQRPTDVRASALVKSATGNYVLGNFGNSNTNGQDTWKQLPLSGDGAIISFTVFRQGIWQTDDQFKVFMNDNAIITTPLATGSGSDANYDWEITQGLDGTDGQAFKMSIRVKTNATSLKLGFGSTLSDTVNKSYSVDNFRVSDTLYISALPAASQSGTVIPVEIIAFGNVMLPDSVPDTIEISDNLPLSVQTRGSISKGRAFNKQTLQSQSSTLVASASGFIKSFLRSRAWWTRQG